MPRSRAVALIAACALMSPAAAFGQGAGDDQYQDPLPDEPRTEQPQDGLSDAPPGGGSGSSRRSGRSGGSGGSGTGGSGGSGGATGSGTAGATGTAGTAGARATAADGQLPNTGSEPILLAYAGITFLLIGVGLRLRTIDPDAY